MYNAKAYSAVKELMAQGKVLHWDLSEMGPTRCAALMPSCP